MDELAAYRQIPGLLVIGPEEYEKAFLGPSGENPLGLDPGWCPRLPFPISVEEAQKRAELAASWGTTAALFLDLDSVGGQETSIVKQYEWFGRPYDGYGPGIVRQDVMWSNWFLEKRQPWAFEPSVAKPTWRIKYELPNWSTNLMWDDQEREVRARGLTIGNATSEGLFLNVARAATGRMLRHSVFARTSTLDGIFQVCAISRSYGTNIALFWNPTCFNPYIGAAVEEVVSG